MISTIVGVAITLASAIIAAAGYWLLWATRTRPQTGATERWSPLATIGAQPLTGHALDPAPTLAATHEELTAVGDAITRFGRNIDAALWEFMAPLDAETVGRLLRARDWAGSPSTGELDLAGLHALLADGREVMCR